MDSSAPPSRMFMATWAVLAGAVMFLLGIWHNDFPSAYHPDEPSKVAQLINGTRDYHHPPLMLTVADAAAAVCQTSREPDALARVGRTLSAVYLAGAVALLTILAGLYGGTRTSVVVAAAALSADAQAILAAHFFKEDAVFMLGLAATFLAGAIHWRRGGRLDAYALGAAAGLAFSSKYIGVVAVAYALVLALLGHRRRWPEVAAGLFAIIVLCNAPALFAHGGKILAGWRLGVSTVQEGNGGVGASVPNFQFLGMLFVTPPLPVLVGAALSWWQLRGLPFRVHVDRWLALSSPLWLIVIFSLSASTAVRYFLPVSLMLCLGAALGLPVAVRWILLRTGRTAPAWCSPALAVGSIWFFGLPGACALLRGFASDDRSDLTRWITNHLAPDAVIAEDALARLPVGAASQRFLSSPVVADLGDIPALRAQGARYVAVCWYDSRRFVDPRKHPSPDARNFLRRREFYQNLPVRARSVWKSELRQPFPLRPGLELFELEP